MSHGYVTLPHYVDNESSSYFTTCNPDGFHDQIHVDFGFPKSEPQVLNPENDLPSYEKCFLKRDPTKMTNLDDQNISSKKGFFKIICFEMTWCHLNQCRVTWSAQGQEALVLNGWWWWWWFSVKWTKQKVKRKYWVKFFKYLLHSFQYLPLFKSLYS